MHSMKARRGCPGGRSLSRAGGATLVAPAVLLAISAAAAVTAGIAWQARFGEEARMSAEAVAVLEQIQEKERAYLEATRSYTSSLSELGLPPPDPTSPWRYQVLAAHVKGRPLLLVEADNGHRRLAMDGQGRLYSSPLAPLPGS